MKFNKGISFRFLSPCAHPKMCGMERREEYHKKMTETPVASLIIRLGIPTTISMLITSIYNLVDTYFVGTLGVSQQGAIGVLFTLQAIIQAFAFLLGHGSGTHVAKYLAIKEEKKASMYVSSAFFVGLAIGGILMLFGLIFLTPFMYALGSSDTVLPYAKDYGMWVLISAPFLIASLILNNNLRYEGKAFYAMIGIGSGGLLNILGDYIFIPVMELGVFGAGMSTAISQFISFAILLFFYFRVAQTRISFRSISTDPSVYLHIAKTGLPSLIRQGLASISGGVLNNLTKPFGDAALAAMSVVNRISNFVMCVGLGIGQGLQPVAAYNYAVKRYDRVEKGILFTVLFDTGVVSFLSLFALIWPESIIRVFNSDSEVIRLGTVALRFAAGGLIFTSVSIVTNMTLQSIQKAWSSSILSAMRNGLAFIPVIFLLVYAFQLGFTGVALAQPIADVITFAVSLPYLIVFLVRLKKKAATDPEASEQS